MHVRSWRTDHLALVPADGSAPLVLSVAKRGAGDLTTQDVFQVSPGGGYLAYATSGVLHVRAADGRERALADFNYLSQMRFSPDGSYLAATVGDSSGKRGARVILLELATGTTRELAAFPIVSQVEWMRDAVVVQAWDGAPQHQVLVELPVGGAATTLLDRPANDLDRFVAAATGTRIVAFTREGTTTHVLSLDAATTSAPHELGVIHDPITNAAASLDGTRVAFTTAAAVFTVTGDARPEAINGRGEIHSLWFSRDGRLGYASPTSVTILGGPRPLRFETDAQIRMLRFDPVSADPLVTTSAFALDITTATPKDLARAEPGTQLLGIDHFRGGIVVWTTDDL